MPGSARRMRLADPRLVARGRGAGSATPRSPSASAAPCRARGIARSGDGGGTAPRAPARRSARRAQVANVAVVRDAKPIDRDKLVAGREARDLRRRAVDHAGDLRTRGRDAEPDRVQAVGDLRGIDRASSRSPTCESSPARSGSSVPRIWRANASSSDSPVTSSNSGWRSSDAARAVRHGASTARARRRRANARLRCDADLEIEREHHEAALEVVADGRVEVRFVGLVELDHASNDACSRLCLARPGVACRRAQSSSTLSSRLFAGMRWLVRSAKRS